MIKNFDQSGIELSGDENQMLAMERALYKDGKSLL